MNRVHIIEFYRPGAAEPFFRMVCYDDHAKACSVAGHVGDRLSDHFGGFWNWLVHPAPFFHSMTPENRAVDAAFAALEGKTDAS